MSSSSRAILPAPSGYVANFEHPYQYGAHTGYWVAGVGFVLALASLAMRLYTRLFIIRSPAADDYVWAIKIAGVHAWDIPLEKFNLFSLLTMLMSVFYVPALGCAKLSILLLYRRLSAIRWFTTCIYIVMAIVASYSVAILFALIFPCQPISANWDVTVTGSKCADKANIYLATASVNIVTDLLILALPIPMVWNLQMPKAQKIGVVGLFAIGSATCITSVVRLIYMIPMLSNVDQSYAVSVPLIWVEVEANLVIIVCCLPSLRRFLRHFAPRLIGERSGDGGERNGPPGYAGNRTIGSIASRALRKGPRSDYGLMSKLDDEVELTVPRNAA